MPPRSRPHTPGGGDGGDPPPPRRRPGGGSGNGGNARSIADAQAQTTGKARDGRAGTSDRSTGSGSPATPAGPPWRASDAVTGAGAGKDLSPPHRRHTVTGSRHGKISAENSVFLRGQEHLGARDVEAIAAGEGRWNSDTQRYEINGRSYGVEPSGRMFPDSGPGMVKLDRNEYAALKEIAQVNGDLSAAPQLTRAPRFASNPDAVAKAKAIYDGTYEP
ncbi:hypothetical protein [Paractinoplanes lichenicola]|uniref:Uncharacterized protein n=1 Tax=Paractinoplanes lichenicola TaxID=2802976 RepID=A0ABS1W5V7_9ACTN|nr:hypothetical protein [Actinoplanes lichenicola]MBL7262077.1 hypothetical protein [Actinoplanes lichenicola]